MTTKLSQAVLLMIYFVFLRIHIVYGIEVYTNTTSNHLLK